VFNCTINKTMNVQKRTINIVGVF